MAISAFAARRATRQTNGEITSQNEAQTSRVTETCNESEEITRPVRKKQKRGIHTTKRTQQADGFVKLKDGSLQDGAKDIESDRDGRSLSLSGSETGVLSMSPIQRLSTFDPLRSKVLSETETDWTVRLHPNDSLAILGQYDLWVRSGAISISGAVIHASSRIHRVYAPSTHSIPPIRPLPNPFGTGNAPVELTIISCRSRMRMLRQIAPKFGRIWNGRQQSQPPFDFAERTFMNIQSTSDDPHHRPLHVMEIPSDWQRTVSRLQSTKSERSPAIIVCGPKGAGKSTFCRILANALLQKTPGKGDRDTPDEECVCFLDLDPGQPEYSPPGELSLLQLQSWNLGPPFSHPTCGRNRPLRTHHFGHTSPKEDPKNYYACALDLFAHYRLMARQYRSCSLIINSAGWIQGNGLELLSDLTHGMDLTDVIYLSTSAPEEIFDTLAQATNRAANTTFHQLDSQSLDFMARPAADLRMMQTLSYFHMSEREGGHEDIQWDPRPLTHIAPLVVHYAGPEQAILGITIFGDAPNVERNIEPLGAVLDNTLNGSLIGVVALDQGTGPVIREHNNSEPVDHGINMADPGAETSDHMLILRTATELPYLYSSNRTKTPLSPHQSFSLGQALIRGIDSTNKTLHLLTPIPINTLQSHSPNIVLVRGTLDTPAWAYGEDFELEKAARRIRERKMSTEEGLGGEEMRRWAERQPWAGVVDGGRRSSGKVRRVRRDIRYRPVGEISE